MTTYRTLTAGAKDASGTIAKPAARTAADCTKAAAIRVPTGISSMSLPAHQLTFKLEVRGELDSRCADVQDQETNPIQ